MSARKVGIVLSGRLTPERITQLLDEGAPVDVFHDVSYIASAAPVTFMPNIRTISDREVPTGDGAAPAEPAPAPVALSRRVESCLLFIQEPGPALYLSDRRLVTP